MAASNGHADVARVLVKEMDADVNIKDNNGETPSDFVPSWSRSAFEGIL